MNKIIDITLINKLNIFYIDRVENYICLINMNEVHYVYVVIIYIVVILSKKLKG